MEELVVYLINYLYVLGAIAFVLERIISKKKGEAFVLKLIDASQYLSRKEFDSLIIRVSSYFSRIYDNFFGEKYFGKKEWLLSSAIAFSYCYIFYLAERMTGFESSLAKQLGFWFVPNLIADIISINFTRWILKRLCKDPSKYLLYVFYDLSIIAICFYICFSFTIIYLFLFSDHTTARIILHPFHLFTIVSKDPSSPNGFNSLFIVIMASSTVVPTLLHILYLTFAFFTKLFTPYLNALIVSLVERTDSLESHPVGSVIIISGIFFLPFIALFMLVFDYLT